MDATLDSGKVYYALVTPRIGVWKARFSLRPIRGGEVGSEEFADRYEETRWIESMETAPNWAASNMTSIREKMNDDLPEWLEQAVKPALVSDDGQSELYQPPS